MSKTRKCDFCGNEIKPSSEYFKIAKCCYSKTNGMDVKVDCDMCCACRKKIVIEQQGGKMTREFYIWEDLGRPSDMEKDIEEKIEGNTDEWI